MTTPQKAAGRKLHVLFLTAQDGLGADVAVHLALARALDRRLVRVSAATTRPQIVGASACEAFASIPDLTHLPRNLGQSIGSKRGLGRIRAGITNLRGVVNLVGLAIWCRRNKVDVVHVTERPRQALFGLLVAKLAGSACVIHAHVSHYPHDATRFANLRLQLADAIVGVSRFTAQTYATNARLDRSRVFAVHNAVDSTVFCPDVAAAVRMDMRQRLGIPADAPVIGCVARLMRWKGQERLLEAFATIRQTQPAAHLVLAGDSSDSAPNGEGDYRDYLLRRSASLGVSDAVHLPGFLAQSDMPGFYGAIDLLAHPALEEPFGLAVVEAMASGRPVVASNRGGTPEIIRDGIDGVLVSADVAGELSAALTRLLGNPSLASRMAASARERVVATFTPQAQAAAMLAIYERIVARRHANPVQGFSEVNRGQIYG